MPNMINPLRYPGAKRQLLPYIGNLLKCNQLEGCTFYEPYAGSAVVGLELLKKALIRRLVLVERDVLLYAFWRSVFEFTDELCCRIAETPIDISTWQSLTWLRDVNTVDEVQVTELGFAGLFFNRTNFSGIINANPIGGIRQKSKYAIDCRFNREKIIEVICDLAKLRKSVAVYHGDAISFMARISKSGGFRQEKSFAFLDPPYYKKGAQMYRWAYNELDHIRLSRFVKSVKDLDWIISYDDDPFICGLYGATGAQYQPIFVDYSAARSTRNRGKELLISNLPLPPFPHSKEA